MSAAPAPTPDRRPSEEALDQVEFECEPQPAVLDPLTARAEDVPLVRRSAQALNSVELQT